MTKIGISKAKLQFSSLVARAMKGETITIMSRGKPAAQLVPPAPEGELDIDDHVEAMLAYRKHANRTLGPGLTVQMLRDEGRR